MAGTEGSYALAELVEQQFRNAVLDYVGMEEFEVYLNYPQKDGRRVAIVDPPDLAWEAVLEEQDERTQ
ncbi:glutamate carboxypeptidase, partial [Aspergillus sclerotialis]